MNAKDIESVATDQSVGWKSRLRIEATRLTVLCSCGLVIVSVLTLFAAHWWVADICANLRVQWTIGLLITAIALACFRKWKWLAVQLVCLGLHLSWFRDGVSSVRDEVVAGPVLLTVTAANVYTGNRRHADIEAELRRTDADVIAVLELSTPLKNHLAGGFSHAYPYSLKEPQDRGNFGIGLYSKYPFESPRADSLQQ